MSEEQYEQFMKTFCRENYEYLVSYSGSLLTNSGARLNKTMALELVHDSIIKLGAVLQRGKTIKDPLPYIITVIANAHIDQKKKQILENQTLSNIKNMKNIELKDNIDSNPPDDASKEIEKLSSSIALENGIKKLPKKYREVLQRVCEGKKRREIAKELNLTINQERTRRSIGIKKLKRRLLKNAEDHKNGTS